MTPVVDHFGRHAASYDARSARWPWASVRSRERSAVVAALGDVRGLRALDLGCGAGFYTRCLLALGAQHVHSVDLAAPMVRELPSVGVTATVADAASVTLSERFERIVCAGMIEFVSDPGEILRNARAHATRDARLVVLGPTPRWPGALYERYHANHAIAVNRAFSRAYRGMAADTGWRVSSVREVFPLALVVALEVAG